MMMMMMMGVMMDDLRLVEAEAGECAKSTTAILVSYTHLHWLFPASLFFIGELLPTSHPWCSVCVAVSCLAKTTRTRNYESQIQVHNWRSCLPCRTVDNPPVRVRTAFFGWFLWSA